MCGGGIVGGLLDVLELEAVVEVVQSQAENRYRWGCRRRRGLAPVRRGTTGSAGNVGLPDIQYD